MVQSALRRPPMWKSWRGHRSKSAGTRTLQHVTLVLSLSSNPCKRKSARITLFTRPARSASKKWLSITQWGLVTSPLSRSAIIATKTMSQWLNAVLGLRQHATLPWLLMLMVHPKVDSRHGVKRFPRRSVLLITVLWWKVIAYSDLTWPPQL